MHDFPRRPGFRSDFEYYTKQIANFKAKKIEYYVAGGWTVTGIGWERLRFSRLVAGGRTLADAAKCESWADSTSETAQNSMPSAIQWMM